MTSLVGPLRAPLPRAEHLVPAQPVEVDTVPRRQARMAADVARGERGGYCRYDESGA